MKAHEILIEVMSNFTPEELSKMTSDELKDLCNEFEDEMIISKQEEKMDEMIYGDPDHERYLMSEEYEADCKQEQWDWLKNA